MNGMVNGATGANGTAGQNGMNGSIDRSGLARTGNAGTQSGMMQNGTSQSGMNQSGSTAAQNGASRVNPRTDRNATGTNNGTGTARTGRNDLTDGNRATPRPLPARNQGAKE
jgi:hypothetical protein